MSTLDNIRKEAKRWLKALRASDPDARARLERAHHDAPAAPGLRDVQHALARERGHQNWTALKGAIRDAGPSAVSPTLEKYESLARDLVVAFESGEPAAMQRLADQFGGQVTWDQVRAGVQYRLETAPESERPPGDFALPHARLVIARQAKFENWDALATLLRTGGMVSAPGAAVGGPPDVPDIGPGMIKPIEMKFGFRVRLHDGSHATTDEVWGMLTAARNGDLDRVMDLVSARPALVRCDYNYMPPLHLAVREHHPDIVRFLCERGAANPKHETYPYRESLLTVARDRGYEEIARVLAAHYREADQSRPADEGGEIEYIKDDDRHRFQQLVNHNALPEVKAMLQERPELARDELASWGEGILSMPANRRDRELLELLLEYGARVPQVTKWGMAYYFKHYEIAAFLMQHGMSPHHMNCHHTTLLHDMAYAGDVRKAALLLDRGADIDAVDEEFQSTPLGLAARFGQREMAGFLLDRGADPDKAIAAWATPLAWARAKGHAGMETLLRRRGARSAGRSAAPMKADRSGAQAIAAMEDAIRSEDAAALGSLLGRHPAEVEAQRPAWLALDAHTIIARAKPSRALPVRPDREAIEREAEAAGEGDAGRVAVARAYGAESWDRLVLACRLVDAIWQDDLDAVRGLVTAHPRLVHEDALIRANSNWGPPMSYAANLGRNRIIRALHGLGARDLQTALDRAVLQGQIDTARMLYEMGARPLPDAASLEGPAETLDAKGMGFLVDLGVELTPATAPVALVLQTYSRNPPGKHQILEIFASRGVALPDTPPMAVHRGRIDLLAAHLERDPGVLSRTFSHQEIFPLALGCHEDATFALHGTPLDGAGLLHLCIEYGEIEIAQWLIDRGADVNLRARVDPDGFGGHTPLFNCVVAMGGRRGRTTALALLLLDRGADPSVRASLRKAVRFADDESLHQYRAVTPLEWGERFHERSLVNEAVVRLLRTLPDE